MSDKPTGVACKPMVYGSVCSGIEAASVAWHPLGWRCAFVSEIEPFPCSVLKHHYPDVPNFGDMTRYKEWPDAAIDVLVGGTPCQAFSVAGLRKGLDDPRGNLTLTFLGVLERYRPRWMVWENVPGVLSDKTGAINALLDGLEQLGYVVDVDILDAQWFGLAQRRRRVFVCGQHRDDLLRKKTTSSALTIAQCLIEILQMRFHELLLELKSTADASTACESAAKPERLSGIERRMRLFCLDDLNGLKTALDHLECLNRQSCAGPEHSVLNGDDRQTRSVEDTRFSDTEDEKKSSNTESSPSHLLDDLCTILNLSTTSTATRATTRQRIFMCSRVTATIAALIAVSNPSSPCFYSAALSALAALKEYTSYARQTTSDLFGDVERFQAWRDFVAQAERTDHALADTPVECYGTVLSLAESLRGDSAPRREAGKGTTYSTSPSLTGSGRGTERCGESRGQDCVIPSVARAVAAERDGYNDGSDQTYIPMVCGTLSDGAHNGGGSTVRTPIPDASLPPVAWTLQELDAKGADSDTKDGHLIPVRMPEGGSFDAVGFSSKDDAGDSGDTSPTLRAMNHSGSHANGGGQVAVAFERRMVRTSGGQPSVELQHALRSDTNTGDGAPCVATSTQVRRLTPTECERLQGFPDNYTLVPHRGKPASDGPRYKALGNSMAVNVMSWIGQRIQLVENLVT